MYCQAVEDCHISSIDPPAYPIASLGCFRPDVAVGDLKPKKVRRFIDLERPLSLQAIMKRHPHCVAIGASFKSRVVLMRMQKGALAVGENHPCKGLGTTKRARPHKPLHHVGQYRMLRQRVEP